MTTERQWKPIRTYQDILFDFYEGIARITINRPRYRNAFTPLTAQEISNASASVSGNSRNPCSSSHRSR